MCSWIPVTTPIDFGSEYQSTDANIGSLVLGIVDEGYGTEQQ
jgi:hypothetical protein